MTGYDTVLRARRMVTAAGETSGCVGVTGGRIAAIAPLEAGLEGRRVVELGDDVALLPGLVDTHVHVNEPGRTEWEGFATATRAAAAGGVTTIVDMPLNSIPPTVDLAALEVKRKRAEGQCFVDVGFWGGAVPGNLGELRSLHDAGVFGFKCFLLHSGVDEFPPLHPANLDAYLATLARLRRAADRARRGLHRHRPRPQRPRPALRGLPRLPPPDGREPGRRPRHRGGPGHRGPGPHPAPVLEPTPCPRWPAPSATGSGVTVETCPHYLALSAEEVPDGATQFKCCPPVREAANRERSGRAWPTAPSTASSPTTRRAPPELKRLDSGDFGTAWGGISSLAARPAGGVDRGPTTRPHPGRRRPLDGRGPGPAGRAGGQGPDRSWLRRRLSASSPPTTTFVVDPGAAAPPAPHHPLRGRTLAGVVRGTWLRGQELTGDQPRGRLLTRGGT